MLFYLVRLIAIGYVLLFLQTHEYLPFGKLGIRPDLMLIFVLYNALYLSLLPAALLGFIVGYVVELFSATNSGLYITIYIISIVVAKGLQKYFDFDSIRNSFCLLLICLFVKFLIISFCFQLIYEYSFVLLEQIWVLDSAFTLALFPGIYYLSRVLLKKNKDFHIKYSAALHAHSFTRRPS